MSRKPGRKKRKQPLDHRAGLRPFLWVVVCTVLAFAVLAFAFRDSTSSNPAPASKSTASIPPTVTFSEHLAPILFENCTSCHRPGQPAPFPLETYDDVLDRADEIIYSVATRRMPPWQADPRCGPFANTRLLTTDEIAIFTRWAEQGMLEGDPAKLPPAPVFKSGWELGPPDLVATAPVAYQLQTGTNDTYYNIVIPLQLDRPRYVRAVEFSQGQAGSVHHAFLRFDATGSSRKLVADSGGPGFPGLHLPPGAFSPDSQFLSWQPGRPASLAPAGMNWKLQPGTDLVLQLHLPAVRVPTAVQPSVAFYFSDEPPTRRAYKVRLTSFTFSIPAGATNYSVREEITLPVPTSLVALLPHAHRLARSVVVSITPPGEPPRKILDIPAWNFEWQSDYNLQPEQALPAGTRLAMEFTFHNPNPHPVSYGPETTDEMAELWALLALHSPADYDALVQAELPLVLRDTIAYNNYRLRIDPSDWRARIKLANALLGQNNGAAALAELQKAAATAPNEADPVYWTGRALWRMRRISEAQRELNRAIAMNPRHGGAHALLGVINLELRRFDAATHWFQLALQINPNDPQARKGLADATAAARNSG